MDNTVDHQKDIRAMVKQAAVSSMYRSNYQHTYSSTKQGFILGGNLFSYK